MDTDITYANATKLPTENPPTNIPANHKMIAIKKTIL